MRRGVGDSLADLSVLQQVRFVMLRGQRVG
jgi:hypothetical protein